MEVIMAKNYNINWRQKDVDKLKRVVKNYNNRITNIGKKHPELKEYLPNKITYSEVRNQIETRRTYNTWINRLNRFTSKSAQPIITKEGVKTTKYELREAQYALNSINRIRARERKKANVSSLKGTMGTIRDANLMPRKNNTQTIPTWKWDNYIKSLYNQSSEEWMRRQNQQYKDNFLSAINTEYGWIGSTLSSLVNQVPIDDLVQMLHDDPVLSIDFVYGEEDMVMRYNAMIDHLYDYVIEHNITLEQSLNDEILQQLDTDYGEWYYE